MPMRRTILIADDEPHIRLLIRQSVEDLEDEGVRILAVADGVAALESIRAERPGLVILDVMMPGMNGYEVCERVKGDDALRSSYIVLLTAKGQEYDRRRGGEVGADRYMTKPFDPDALVSIARQVLKMDAAG